MKMLVNVFLGVLLSAGLAISQKCGKPQTVPATGSNSDRIVGGRAAITNSWPWQVSLQDKQGHFCGGALINNQWIITAAHCLVGVKAVDIKLGKHDITRKEGGEIKIRSAVRGIRVHPKFSQTTLAHDIALIKLSSPVTFSKRIQPVCLPKQAQELRDGVYVYVTGWGNTGSRSQSSVLKQAMVPTVNFKKCVKMTPKHVPPQSICTGFPKGGHNPCFGDSGGPLVYQSGGTWSVMGVVSWGPQKCAIKEEPAIFVKVSSYLSWIRQTIGQ